MKNLKSSGSCPTLSVLAAAAFIAFHSGAHAFSLGRMTVQSYLGDPLRAEVEVVGLTPEEATTLRSGLASTEAFRAAGVDLNGALAGLQATLQRRSDGRPVIRLVGERSVSEPFVDVILDFSWATGRLQRSYTLLIDPPPTRPTEAAQAPSVVTNPVLSAPSPTPPPAAVFQPRAVPQAPVQAAKASPAPTRQTQTNAGAMDAEGAYRVRQGDTLSLIAGAHAQPGVSLDQMLVSLYRGNPDAFLSNNMNRLKAGVVLALPDAQTASALSAQEARQVIQAQSADFAAFRQRLAQGAPEVKTAEAPRQAGGKVDAAIQDKKGGAPATTPDQLTLSRAAAKSAAAEAKVSKEAERKAADTRVAELSRNVAELKRLSKDTAEVPVAPASPAAAKSPVVLPALPIVVAPVPAAPPSATLPTASASVPANAPGASASGAVAAVASAPAVVASAASAPKLATRPAPAVAEEPGFLDALLENPFVLPAVVCLVGLLAGLGVMRLRKRSSDQGSETSFVESKLQPDSFFGVSGGQRVDTREDGGNSSSSSSLSYSLSQLDAIGDVDPVAEADVYLAYGRDLQAEEILKEALRTDPGRIAIRAKLLEVYAKRADAKGVEAQAVQLLEMTGGVGDDWVRAQELGRQIDPENALYAPVGPIDEVDIDTSSDAPPDLQPQAFERSLPAAEMDSSLQPEAGVSTLDLDIDLDSVPPIVGLENTQPLAGLTPIPMPDLEFDESTESPPGRDFHEPVMNFDFDPPELPGRIEPTIAEAPVRAPVEFDFGDLSLDLDPPAAPAPAPVDVLPEDAPMSFDLDNDNDLADPMERKLELADEFRRIGDVEGARDLLDEVLNRGNESLRARAQRMLSEID